MVKRLLLCLSLVLMTGACAENLKVDVTRFNQQPMGFMGRSFSVYSEANQAASLEFQHYAGEVGTALQAHGLTAAPSSAAADLVVQVHYASKDPHTQLYSEPDWNMGMGWHRRGPWNYPAYDVQSVTLYTQMLEVDIFDGPAWRQGKPQMLFQGRAVGDSEINDVNTSASALIEALFTNFPGQSGVTERVYVPLTK